MLLINKGVGLSFTNIAPPDTVQLLFTIVLFIRQLSRHLTKMNNTVSASDGSVFVRDIVGDYIINQYWGTYCGRQASNINCPCPRLW